MSHLKIWKTYLLIQSQDSGWTEEPIKNKNQCKDKNGPQLQKKTDLYCTLQGVRSTALDVKWMPVC